MLPSTAAHHASPLILVAIPLTPSPTLFPYTTLFRSPPAGSCEGPAPMFGRLPGPCVGPPPTPGPGDRKSTRLNSSHVAISYAVFCLKKKSYRRECTRQFPYRIYWRDIYCVQDRLRVR